MPDMGQLDWRKIVEVAVRAALVGNAKSCDVLVLRRTSREMSRENEPSGVKQPVETGTSGLHERRDDSVGQGVVLVEKFVGGTGPKGAGVWLKTVEGVLERL